MRTLEIVITILLAIYLIWPLVSQRKRPLIINLLPSAALVVTLVHLVIEKYRWQMLPLEVFTLVLFAYSMPEVLKKKEKTNIRIYGWKLAGSIISLVVFIFAVALPILLPVPHLPEPSGPYKVGTMTLVMTDPARKEIYSGKDEARKFLVQFWYPTSPPAGAQTAPWMANARIVAPAIARNIHLPGFFLDHLVLAKTSAYEDAPLDRSGAPYPVLIFSHGWTGFRAQNTFQAQELASQGYIVATMEHPYGSVVTVFPDGKVIYNNPAALPKDVPPDEYETAARILVNQWAGDIGFALDQLTIYNQNDPNNLLTGAIDMEKVGVFGHSTGGGATIQFCGTDTRCKAGLTMDAFMRPVSKDVMGNGVKQPFFFMFSEFWPFPRNNELFDQFYSHVNPSSKVVTILGTDHYDFTDLPAFSPLAPWLGLKGPINGARVQKIINTYSLAFFDKVFKGTPTTLLNQPAPDFPEVQFR